jgi:hypothetical protein
MKTIEFIEKIKNEFIEDKNWFFKIKTDNKFDGKCECNIYIITNDFEIILIELISTTQFKEFNYQQAPELGDEALEYLKISESNNKSTSLIENLKIKVGKISLDKNLDITIDNPMKKIYDASKYQLLFEIDELLKILRFRSSFL